MSLVVLLLAALARGAAAPDRRPVVALGDSTTAGTPRFQSPVEWPPEGRGDERASYPYWLAKKSGRKVLNRGVNGERADEIRARFERDVEEAAPSAVVILAGVNDAYQHREAADTESDLLWMWARAAELHIPVYAATILPFDRATPDQAERIEALNAFIRAQAPKAGAKVCDTAKAAAGRNPRLLKGSPDGLHPDAATYRLVGEAVAGCLSRR